MRASRRLLALAATGVLGTLSTAAAAQATTLADLAGTWTRAWPADECHVSLEIRADGSTTTRDGAHAVDAVLAPAARPAGKPDDPFLAVQRRITRDDGGQGCGPKDGAVRALLPYGHGRGLALCTLANLGGCTDWFERDPVGSAPPATAGRHDLFGVVERQAYGLVPEDLASFELVRMPVLGDPLFIDPEAPGGSRPLRCAQSTAAAVVGRGATAWQFVVSVCDDAAAIESLAAGLARSERSRALIGSKDIPAQDKRRYGLSTLSRPLADGGRSYYTVTENQLLWHVAVHVDADRRRAVVLTAVDMGTLEGVPRQFAANPLYVDPAPLLQSLVERIAHDPDVLR